MRDKGGNEMREKKGRKGRREATYHRQRYMCRQ